MIWFTLPLILVYIPLDKALAAEVLNDLEFEKDLNDIGIDERILNINIARFKLRRIYCQGKALLEWGLNVLLDFGWRSVVEALMNDHVGEENIGEAENWGGGNQALVLDESVPISNDGPPIASCPSYWSSMDGLTNIVSVYAHVSDGVLLHILEHLKVLISFK
ncbi:hypothetical protein L1887_36262 [Cichorium endivia]|nr:hypothetical protein L1887_36262 [Cichorium endivia]